MRLSSDGIRRATTAAALAFIALGATSVAARPVEIPTFPESDTTIPGFPDVIGEFVEIPGAAAPGTPAPLNKATFLRLRSALDGESPHRVDAVVVAQPGFASTAGLWFNTAAAMVHNASERVCSDKPDKHCRLEVWVVQRRSNLMSDTLGLFLARAANDPKIALDYYYGPQILGSDPSRPGKFPLAQPDSLFGKPGSIFRPLTQGDVPFEAEWGYETFSADVTAMISLIKEESGAKNIFLAGHSQGGLFTSVYAGTLLPSGQLGQDLLAGLIFLDGGPTPPPDGETATPAATDALLAVVNGLRAGTIPVFGASLGPNVLFGQEILDPGTGAETAIAGLFSRKEPQAETLFPQAAIGGLPLAPAGDAFLEQIRTTNQAWAGLTFDPNPLPAFAPPPLQTPTITLLGSRMGTFDFTPIAGVPQCDPLGAATTPPCAPNADTIDPNTVYTWLDGGGRGPVPQPSNAEAYINLAGFAPSRTNVHPVTVDFPVSGLKTIYGGEETGLFWYESARYDDDMTLLAGFNQIVIKTDNVNINVNKSLISIPIYAAKGPLTPVIPGLPFDNPYPLVTDYSEINPKGVLQTPAAAALSPINPAINSALYNHSDFPTADDSLVGQVLPGQPGGNLVADTVIAWIFARAHGQAIVPTPLELGVVTTR
jgi:pimeloyl-ACP methyl ester carboxylesterase